MTGTQLRRIRTRLKLTQVQFAARVGVTANTVARWERDEVTITEPMARLIRLTAQPTARPDERIENADWPKRHGDVDVDGSIIKPKAVPMERRTSKRKQGGK